MSRPLRVGVVGVGHLGARHAQIYAQLPGVRLVAVCDSDATRSRMVGKALHCAALTDYRGLVGRVDALSLAVPTTLHGLLGLALLSEGIHLLIEKPISTRLAEANALIRMARKRGCILQIGHVERFNAAIRMALRYLTHPRFIEVHRLSPYPFRGTDVSVVLDVMIHDLDLLLALMRCPIVRVESLGVCVLSNSEDMANARLSFSSGCIANLTASRVSDETIRRIRVIQEDSYLSIDYKEQTVELAKRRGRTIQRVALPVNRRPALQEELMSFVRAVRLKRPPVVCGEDGKAALALALRIERAMRHRRTAMSREPSAVSR